MYNSVYGVVFDVTIRHDGQAEVLITDRLEQVQIKVVARPSQLDDLAAIFTRAARNVEAAARGQFEETED